MSKNLENEYKNSCSMKSIGKRKANRSPLFCYAQTESIGNAHNRPHSPPHLIHSSSVVGQKPPLIDFCSDLFNTEPKFEMFFNII